MLGTPEHAPDDAQWLMYKYENLARDVNMGEKFALYGCGLKKWCGLLLADFAAATYNLCISQCAFSLDT